MTVDSPAERPNLHLPYHQTEKAHHRLLARLARDHTAAGRVLEVGCGLGHALRELRRLSPDLEIVGADSDEGCLERTRGPGIGVILMAPDRFDVESLGEGYNTVLMSHVLEHLPHPTEAIERLLEIVRPGGFLILGVPNPVTPANILSCLLRRARVNPGHLHTWDRAHWVNFLENRLRLEVVEYAEDEIRLFPAALGRRIPPLGRLQVALVRWLPWFSFTQFAVVRRPAKP